MREDKLIDEDYIKDFKKSIKEGNDTKIGQFLDDFIEFLKKFTINKYPYNNEFLEIIDENIEKRRKGEKE